MSIMNGLENRGTWHLLVVVTCFIRKMQGLSVKTSSELMSCRYEGSKGYASTNDDLFCKDKLYDGVGRSNFNKNRRICRFHE